MITQNWLIDTVTGDYVMKGGKPVLDTTVIVPVYIRAKAPRTKWLYAPDKAWGSDFYKTTIRHDNNSGKQLQGVMLRALQPMINDKRIVNVTITALKQALGVYLFETDVVQSQGQTVNITLSPIY